MTGPSSDPIALDEAKAHCRVSHADEDGLIAGYILAARQYAETYTRRAFVTQTWDYTIDDCWPRIRDQNGCERCRILLPKPPVQSVASVTYVDSTGVLQTLSSAQYRVLNLNQERAEAFIDPAYGVTWPAVRRQAQTITVRFTAGYHPTANPFPEPIRQGMLIMIDDWFNNRTPKDEIPRAADALLFPFRLFY